MNNRVRIAIAALAVVGAVSGAQMLTTSAFAQEPGTPPPAPGGFGQQQGGFPGGPGGGGFGQRGPGGPMAHNDTAKVALSDAVSAATAKVSGYANEARLVGRETKQWIVHVVTKAASDQDMGAGKFVIINATTGKVLKVADQMPRMQGGPGGPGGQGGPGGPPPGGPGGPGGPGEGGPGGPPPGEGGGNQ